MTHKKKTLLTALLTLSILSFSAPAFAGDNHRYKDHHGGGHHDRPNYGWHDHKGHNGRNDNRHDNRWHNKRNNHAYRYNFDMHVPRHLKNSRSRLPVFIVLDGKGRYRGQHTRSFWERKAAREGFILAYAYDPNRYGHHMSNRDKDYLIRSVLNMLDNGHYRPDTRRVNFYFNF